MGKMSGVFTQIRGKVGSTIFQVLNGEQIVKTMAIPSNPESSGQVAQRGVFADIISCFKSVASSWVGFFFNPFTSGNKTGWGNFISKNLISMGKVAFDITKAVVGYGSLEPIVTISATYDTTDGEFVVTFSDDTLVNGADTDIVSFLVVDSDSNKIIGKFLDADSRDAGTFTENAESGFTATNVEIFAVVAQSSFFVDQTGLISTSVNCTCTAPV